ncbi:MAG: YiiD C-terminal domain-containing protein, partial [Acidobacteriota bacterium]
NRNLNGTIFGGAIFSAGDPYHAVLYWQVLGRLGRPVQVWLRQASIRYYKPAASDLMLDYALSDEDIEQACTALDRDGRFVRRFVTDAVDAEGDICAKIETEVYVRQLRRGQKSVSGF